MVEEIKQGNNEFYVGKGENNPEAKITYKQAGDNEIEIDHTGVSDELGDQGLGTKLVDAVVGHAHQNNLKIIASCPFAKDVLEKNDSYQDVYSG